MTLIFPLLCVKTWKGSTNSCVATADGVNPTPPPERVIFPIQNRKRVEASSHSVSRPCPERTRSPHFTHGRSFSEDHQERTTARGATTAAPAPQPRVARGAALLLRGGSSPARGKPRRPPPTPTPAAGREGRASRERHSSGSRFPPSRRRQPRGQ